MTGVQTCALPICFPVTIGGVDTDKAIQEIKTMIQQEGWYKADADLRVQLKTESTETVKEIQQRVELIKKQQFTEEQKAKKFYEEAMTQIEEQKVLAKKWEVLNEEAIEKRINNQVLQETKNEYQLGESIETKVKRITENNEPITDGAPIIYTNRDDGVLPACNIS